MRVFKTRSSDSTFDLNLAPVLDIIVSIIPMLLLSVAFVQIKMIEAPTPQVVMDQANPTPPPKPETTVTLKVSKVNGFAFHIMDEKGRASVTNVQLAGGLLDYNGLYAHAIKLKDSYPTISRLQLEPEPNVTFDELVQVMDQVRQKQRAPAAVTNVSDAAKAAQVEIQYLFPDIIFSSVGG